MQRRKFLAWTAAGSLSGIATILQGAPASKIPIVPRHSARFELEELTVSDLQSGMRSGQFTAVGLTRQYLEQIERNNRQGPQLGAVIEINPDALQIARDVDQERKARGPRGPLQGIPVLIKDNIDTHDQMTCTAGSLALAGSRPPEDAFLIRKLRQAGAVILGKANLSEWANFRGSRSISGWSARGGFTRNPYILDRNPSGSSSGSAVAVSANLCAVAVGTETNGSIVSPSSYTGIVGVKPTVGLVSRAGIIPISSSQDTAGPMTRTVRDAAILLSCMAGFDPLDPSDAVGIPRPAEGIDGIDYARDLETGTLKGARIGVARSLFHKDPDVLEAFEEQVVATLREAGAILIDPVDIPDAGDKSWEVMLYEFKAGLNAYLARPGLRPRVRTLKELIAFNEENQEQELHWFGQETFLAAEAKGPLTDPGYQEALRVARRLARDEGLDRVLREHQLDAIIAPTTGPAHVTDVVYGDRDTGGSSTPAAVAGYPSVTVPAGFVSELPVGFSFFAGPWTEARLLKLAYAYERLTQRRRPPRFKPTLS